MKSNDDFDNLPFLSKSLASGGRRCPSETQVRRGRRIIHGDEFDTGCFNSRQNCIRQITLNQPNVPLPELVDPGTRQGGMVENRIPGNQRRNSSSG